MAGKLDAMKETITVLETSTGAATGKLNGKADVVGALERSVDTSSTP